MSNLTTPKNDDPISKNDDPITLFTILAYTLVILLAVLCHF